VSGLLGTPSLRQRITRLAIVPITLFTLVLLALVAINHLRNERAHLDELATTLVDLLVKKVSVAVFLSDEQNSRQALDTLSSVPTILFAAASNQRTGFSVRYERDGLDAETRRAVAGVIAGDPPAGLLPGMRRESRLIHVDGETVGEFSMVLDASSLRRSVMRLVYVACLAIALAIILGIILNRVLARRLLTPVLELQDAMNRFSRAGSLEAPLPRTGQQEMDVLYDGFERMARDIEERDARLRRHRKSLEAEVRDRSEELVLLNHRRMDWLGRMAHFLRHELDNKILGIATTLDLIERNDRQGRFATYVDRARRTTTQMHRLLRDVAETTSLEAALVTEDKRVVDLAALVDAQLEEYSHVYPQVRFEPDIEPGVFVLGNGDRLVQLLDKLVANAVEHVTPGAPVQVSLERRGDDAILVVKMPGIPCRPIPGACSSCPTRRRQGVLRGVAWDCTSCA
jgi:signal transduction histidine kinase